MDERGVVETTRKGLPAVGVRVTLRMDTAGASTCPRRHPHIKPPLHRGTEVILCADGTLPRTHHRGHCGGGGSHPRPQTREYPRLPTRQQTRKHLRFPARLSGLAAPGRRTPPVCRLPTVPLTAPLRAAPAGGIHGPTLPLRRQRSHQDANSHRPQMPPPRTGLYRTPSPSLNTRPRPSLHPRPPHTSTPVPTLHRLGGAVALDRPGRGRVGVCRVGVVPGGYAGIVQATVEHPITNSSGGSWTQVLSVSPPLGSDAGFAPNAAT